MLELKKITKDYAVGDGKVQALKGVDIDGQPLEQIIRLALKNMVKG